MGVRVKDNCPHLHFFPKLRVILLLNIIYLTKTYVTFRSVGCQPRIIWMCIHRELLKDKNILFNINKLFRDCSESSNFYDPTFMARFSTNCVLDLVNDLKNTVFNENLRCHPLTKFFRRLWLRPMFVKLRFLITVQTNWFYSFVFLVSKYVLCTQNQYSI